MFGLLKKKKVTKICNIYTQNTHKHPNLNNMKTKTTTTQWTKAKQAVIEQNTIIYSPPVQQISIIDPVII